MTDPVNPIAAEFGEAEGAIPVVPIKPQQEIDPTDSFQKEMEKKSRTVQGKDDERQAKQDTRQLEHEIIVNKPSVDEAEAARSSQRSILDVQKPSSDKNPSKEVNPLDPVPTASKTSSATESNNDLSQGQDTFGQNLPTQIPSTGKGKEEVEAIGKSVNTSAPEGEKKKIEVSVDMQSSTGHKDSSPQEKKTFIATSPEKNKQTEAPSTPVAKTTSVSTETTPIAKKSLEGVEADSAPKPSVHVTAQATKIDIHPSQDTALQVSQPEKKITAPVSTENAFGQTSQDPKQQDGSIHLDTVEPLTPEQTEKLAATTAPQFAAAPPSEIRKETWISQDEQEKAAGHAKIEEAAESQAADQEQKERDQQENEEHSLSQSSQNLLNQLFPDLNGTAPPEAIGFDRLPAHILDLFDRMVGVITVMQMQGKTETTLYLSEQQSPLFKNTAVTITTFSTAPMAYNIEFKAPPETSPLLQKHVGQLKTAFKDPKKEFNFQIHEIMISLQEDESK